MQQNGRNPPGTWTRESVIDAFQAEVQKTGRLPSTYSWLYRSPGHPTTSRVLQLFGSWNQFVVAAGFTPRTPVRSNYKQDWSTEEIIAHLQRWARKYGRAPSTGQWETLQGGPSLSLVRLRFGTWENALRAAGVYVERRDWTREEALAKLEEQIEKLGRRPSSTEWERAGRGGLLLPSLRICRKLFGSWTAFLAAADPDNNYRPGSRWSKSQVIQELHDWIDAHGRVPSLQDWYYSVSGKPRWGVVRHMFGNWTNFLEEAGLEPVSRRGEEEIAHR